MQAVLGAETEKYSLAAEEDNRKLGVGVLQRKVHVAGRRRTIV
jgi:hypothetical protein